MKRANFGSLAALFVSMGALAACGSAGEAGGQDLPGVVFSGFPFDIGSMPAVVMAEEGIDRDHGFVATFMEVDPESSRNALLMGDSDVAMEQDAVGAAIAQAAGHDVLVFLPNVVHRTGVVELPDSPHESLEQLEGAIVGHPGLDSGVTSTVSVAAQVTHGVDINSFDLRQASFPALSGLLEQGEIDAMVNTDPYLVLAEERLGADPIFISNSAMEAEWGWAPHLTDLTARADWLQENPELALSVEAAWKEAVAWILDADFQNLGEEPYAGYLMTGLNTEDDLQVYLDHCAQLPCFDTSWNGEEIDFLNDYLSLVAEDGLLLQEPPSSTVAVILEELLAVE